METRDAILGAVSYAASSFLRASDWQESSRSLLGRLGEATEVDRIYVFENGVGAAGELVATQRFEWAADGVTPQLENPRLRDWPYDAGGFGRWAEVLSGGEVIAEAVARLPAGESDYLAAQGIVSIVVVPIFAVDHWWGFMGFDDCRRERSWSPGEIEALRAAAGALGAAVERRRIQLALDESARMLRQFQRLEAIGQLAGGVAHDFNNYLTVILGQVELLHHDATRADQRQGLEVIREAARRAAGLTRQLLAIGRQQTLEIDVIDLSSVVERLGPMLTRLAGPQVALTLDVDPQAGLVAADPHQLEQVIVNLVANARDAMPGGGTITVRTRQMEVEQTAERLHAGQRSGRYLVLSVSDTGTGMDSATRARVFEPFFTTKPAGRGTGLGLTTAYGIVKQSGGWLWCASAPGTGTTFEVHLPLHRRAGASEEAAEGAAPAH